MPFHQLGLRRIAPLTTRIFRQQFRQTHLRTNNAMKVAVEGCCHGQLDAIYSHIHSLETQGNYKVDLLLICGDFQAIRNHADLQCMAVPHKYKELGGFYKYYTGEKVAPILTIVIGGNHEASNYMWELYHGGWLARNIYFLGHAGCVRVNGVRIAGASGIFKAHDFQKGMYEQLPYTPGSLRSIYHIREFNVRRLSLLSQPTIFLSHDWPQSIEHYGNLQALLSRKSFLRQDISNGSLGSPPLMGLLRTLKPEWWFSAHLHARYEATVVHESPSAEGSVVAGEQAGGQGETKNPDEIAIDDDVFDSGTGGSESSAAAQVTSTEVETPASPSVPAPPKQNPDEITLDDEEDTVEVLPPPSAPAPVTTPRGPGQVTHFLALDKCLPKRQFLEVVDVSMPLSTTPSTSPPVLEFDPEWLAVTRAFHPWFSTTHHQAPFPDEAEARAAVSTATQWVLENLQKNDPTRALLVDEVQIFAPTAPAPVSPSPNTRVNSNDPQPPAYSNPQTEAFCRMLEIENKINPDVGVGVGAVGGSGL
ncbi:DBR1-domain-containing protein [Macrolepiota fuliginosa MF-IS2]|uniref:DBR1-domain-containing protein n=1 Tax=Macrolepiota fuliginosa MF-IS2 TaxID=1400762 RepID=A0A9P6C042_9AGAR|nr:DBR1-domain-containing protein [Macrolepiota fuliginosa MF-IS2]